jgi:hypothetical protein
MDGRRGLDRVTDSIDNLRAYLLVLVVQDHLAAVVWPAAVVAAARHHGPAAAHRTAHRPPPPAGEKKDDSTLQLLLSGQGQGTKTTPFRAGAGNQVETGESLTFWMIDMEYI